MKATVYGLSGEKLKEIELPKAFEAEFEPELIKRAVLAIQTAKLQRKGPYPRAGRNNSAVYRGKRDLPAMERGINVEHARLPRLKNRRGLLQGRVAAVSHALGGPRAHRLMVEKTIEEKVNKKEKKKATISAIASTGRKDLVEKRGHKFGEISFPIIVENKFEDLQKTKEVLQVLNKLGLSQDIDRAKNNRKIRAGKGRRRGRKYKRVKSLLLVTGENNKVFKAARNLEGVDIVKAKNLNAFLLAPGTLPGRLTVWTENSLKAL